MNIEPLISYPALLIGSILFLMAIKLVADIIVYFDEKKSPQGADTPSELPASVSQQAIQRYYNIQNIHKGA